MKKLAIENIDAIMKQKAIKAAANSARSEATTRFPSGSSVDLRKFEATVSDAGFGIDYISGHTVAGYSMFGSCTYRISDSDGFHINFTVEF